MSAWTMGERQMNSVISCSVSCSHVPTLLRLNFYLTTNSWPPPVGGFAVEADAAPSDLDCATGEVSGPISNHTREGSPAPHQLEQPVAPLLDGCQLHVLSPALQVMRRRLAFHGCMWIGEQFLYFRGDIGMWCGSADASFVLMCDAWLHARRIKRSLCSYVMHGCIVREFAN